MFVEIFGLHVRTTLGVIGSLTVDFCWAHFTSIAAIKAKLRETQGASEKSTTSIDTIIVTNAKLKFLGLPLPKWGEDIRHKIK